MKKLVKCRSINWLPDYFADSVLSINFDELRQRGIKACMFDLDHTLLVQHEVVIDVRLVEHLKQSGMKLFIATNRYHSAELDRIAMQIGAAGIMHAKSKATIKPRKAYYHHAIELTGLKPKQVAMIGDRLVQDVWGAKRTNILTVLVGKYGPIRGSDHILTLHDRLLPVIFKRCYKKT